MYGTVHTLCFSRPYLEFADDLALLAHSFNNVQVFGGPACSVRLRINIDKSKIMKVTTDCLHQTKSAMDAGASIGTDEEKETELARIHTVRK